MVTLRSRAGSRRIQWRDQCFALRRMVMTAMFPYLRLAVAACAIFTLAVPAAAGDASRWDGDARSAIRLIAGSHSGDVVHAGVEIRLKPGWHTYWRYPGDAGVPPRFDFQGSQNLKSVDVLWPAPQRMTEAGMTAIGYDRDVILPLRHRAAGSGQAGRAAAQARLRDLREAVRAGRRQGRACSRPRRRAHRTPLIDGRSARAEEGRRSARARASPSARCSGTAARTSRASSSTLRHQPALTVDLFAEGPTPEWALPVPNRDRRGRIGPAALHLRARRRAARRQLSGRPRDPDGGRRRRGDRGHDPSRLIRRAR